MKIWVSEIKEILNLYESIKGQIPELDKELKQLITTDDANVVMLYSRRCLEVIITDLCESELKRPRKTEPLKGIIDKLNSEEKVPSHIITSMHGLNSLSAYGVHPKDFDPEQVKPALNNIAIILRWYLRYKESQTIDKLKVEEEIKTRQPDNLITTRPKSKKVLYLLFTAIILIILLMTYLKIFKRDTLESYRAKGGISIAVLPFQNMTNDTTKNILQNWIQDNLIAFLSNSEELKVRQMESTKAVMQGKGLSETASLTPSLARAISHTLDANVFIYGSISQTDTIIRINTKLINSKTEEVIKSFQIDGTSRKILNIIDSLSRMLNNFLVVSKLERETRFAYQHLTITNSPEAYRYFIFGNNAFGKGDFPASIKLYQQALDIDSNLTMATLLTAYAYSNQGLIEEGKKCCLKIYNKREMMPLRERIWTNMAYSDFFGTPYEAIGYLRQLQEIDEQVPNFYFNLGAIYYNLHQYDNAIVELEKGLKLFKKWNSKPFWSMHYYFLGMAYCKTGQYKKAKQVYEKAEQDFPDEYILPYYQSILFLSEGDTLRANKYIIKFKSFYKEISASDADITTGLAEIYAEANINDKAEEYYQNALLFEPKNPARIYNLAKFLIEKNQNIDEGLELVEKVIKSSQDKYAKFSYFDTKGYGLFKQGKNKEALKLLEQNWDLRPIYNHEIYLHLEEVKKAVAEQK
jgi:tetratricopeptide (TPR) repeat protein